MLACSLAKLCSLNRLKLPFELKVHTPGNKGNEYQGIGNKSSLSNTYHSHLHIVSPGKMRFSSACYCSRAILCDDIDILRRDSYLSSFFSSSSSLGSLFNSNPLHTPVPLT